MNHYAKIINDSTNEVCVGLGANEKFYISLGMEEMDVEKSFDGRWYISGYTPKTPPKGEQLAALTAEYRQEKSNLCEAYTTASMQGDTETAQSVAADMADLDEWFDEEYKAIEEGSAE